MSIDSEFGELRRTPSPMEIPRPPHTLPPCRRRQLHFENIRDLGTRAEDCWAEYRESEIMKCRCSLVHWQSRQTALEAEVAYTAEVVNRKIDVLSELEKNYSEAKRHTRPVSVHGQRAPVHAEKLATDYPPPVHEYGIKFKRSETVG